MTTNQGIDLKSLDESDEDVNINYSSSLAFANNFTIEAWVKPQKLSGVQRIFTKYSAYSFGLVGDQIRFTAYSINNYDTNQAKLAVDTWYHLAVAMHPANDIYFYVDGELVQAVSGSQLVENSNSCVIGSGNIEDGEYWYGQIAEVRVWKTFRGKKKIKADLSRSLTGNEPDLVGYWLFNETSGNQVRDQTSNTNHGTIQGDANWKKIGAVKLPPRGLLEDSEKQPGAEKLPPRGLLEDSGTPSGNVQIIRRQVAIYGQVSDAATGLVIPGALVKIEQMPEKFKKLLELRSQQYGSQWKNMRERPDQTISSVDGYFYFLDLPDGEYTLTASLPSAGTRYDIAKSSAVSVTRDSQEGNIVKTNVNITLPPTAIKGQIVDTDKSPVAMAKINIEGTSDYTFSDSKGNYLFSALETSQPPKNYPVKVNVSARGFSPVSQQAELSQGIVQELNFSLATITSNGSSS